VCVCVWEGGGGGQQYRDVEACNAGHLDRVVEGRGLVKKLVGQGHVTHDVPQQPHVIIWGALEEVGDEAGIKSLLGCRKVLLAHLREGVRPKPLCPLRDLLEIY